MNLLFSCIGKRGYIADFFRPFLEEGDQIIGTSNTKWTPGFEHCDRNYILPNIGDPNYLPSVFEVCKRESISGILSFFDPDVVALSKQFEDFVEMGIIPIIPRQEIAEICFDKYKTYQFLTEKGFITAKTYLDFETAMSDIRSGSLSFPLFVKPRTGFGSALTFKAHNNLELEAFFHYAPDMIIQEEMSGEAIDFDILNDINGQVLSVVPWKKYRSRMGETEQAETFDDQNVVDFGVRLGTTLGHIGPLDADLFLNGTEVSVLEINLRFGGGYPVSHLAGADFPSKIISMIKGQVINPSIGDYKSGTVMMKDNLIIGGLESEFFAKKLINIC
jgi:carbamoyl-phosphate synthase large subunit